jgi:NAD(P)-dependent dehydrogenase (short-subunit alcohol dehydrogenase family)
MPTILITGSNRGLGLEFCRQYAADGWRVIATCRKLKKVEELKKIAGDVHSEEMDITDLNQINRIAKKLKGEAIDILLNNAATLGPKDEGASFGRIDVDAWLEAVRINTIAPLKITEAFLKHVKASTKKTIVFISSRSSSITERGILSYHKPGGSYIYRSSKAALNSVARSLAFDLAPYGIGVLILHHGWVKTDMGGKEARLDIKASVSSMRKVIERFTFEDSGIFRNYNGEIIPW